MPSFVGWAVIVLLPFIALEFVGQLALHFRDETRTLASYLIDGDMLVQIDAYEVTSNEAPFHWKLKKGYDGSDGVRVNQHGLKGPELLPQSDALRVMTIGDSVTFGFSNVDYPNFMRAFFAQTNQNIEVLNASTEGYGTKQVAVELKNWLDQKPDIVTVMIGWNDLFSQFACPEGLATTFWAQRIARFLQSRIEGPQAYALSQMHRKLKPSLTSEMALANTCDLRDEIDAVEKILKRIKERGGRVVILTLAHLFEADRLPSSDVLEIGHVPDWMNNPVAFARLAERYNAGLRELALKLDVDIIDVEHWGKTRLEPRALYFSDTVHMTRAGYKKLGNFLAMRILRIEDQP